MRLDGVEVKVSLDSDQTATAVQALNVTDGATARRGRSSLPRTSPPGSARLRS
jgi:hypothetical protein